MRAVVTGGAGFIGSNLVDSLLSVGLEVIVVDNLSTGFMKNIPNGVRLIEGNVADPMLWENLEPADYLFHLAALTSVVESQENPILCEESNVHSVIYLLEYARKKGVKKIIFASSAAIYGDSSNLQREDHLPMPKSPYGLSKLAGEHLLHMNYLEHSIPYVAFRMFNVFGPRQSITSSYASVIPIFMDRVLSNRGLLIHGDGHQTRDFVYVEQVVNFYLKAMESAVTGVFNLGSGESKEILDLASLIQQIGDAENLNVEFADSRPGDIRHSRADVSKLKSIFSFSEIEFKKALQETYSYYSQCR